MSGQVITDTNVLIRRADHGIDNLFCYLDGSTDLVGVGLVGGEGEAGSVWVIEQLSDGNGSILYSMKMMNAGGSRNYLYVAGTADKSVISMSQDDESDANAFLIEDASTTVPFGGTDYAGYYIVATGVDGPACYLTGDTSLGTLSLGEQPDSRSDEKLKFVWIFIDYSDL